jgi:hypothetical protein
MRVMLTLPSVRKSAKGWAARPTFDRIHDDEVDELETALRDVWEIEEKNRKR